MSLPVSLKDFLFHLEEVGDETAVYLNQRTGQFVVVTEEDLSLAEDDNADDFSDCPDWQREAVEEARAVIDSDDHLPLPDQFEIDEYAMMESFCLALDDRAIGDALLERIRGGGAFRRFKDGVYRYKIANAWFRFRDEKMEQVAIRWLEAHEIPYARDLGPDEQLQAGEK